MKKLSLVLFIFTVFHQIVMAGPVADQNDCKVEINNFGYTYNQNDIRFHFEVKLTDSQHQQPLRRRTLIVDPKNTLEIEKLKYFEKQIILAKTMGKFLFLRFKQNKKDLCDFGSEKSETQPFHELETSIVYF